MRVVLQRVRSASVSVDGQTLGAIQRGLLVYVGIAPDDGPTDVDFIARKIRYARVFSDDAGKMNLDVLQIGGGVLLISNFTLYADMSQGRRPAFTGAATPAYAEALFLRLADALRELGVPVGTGRFGADMSIPSDAEGPVNLWLDSRD